MITPTQRKLLLYIQDHASRGYCPRFDEMRTAMGFRTKGSVARVVDQLEERGYIKRIPHRQQSIEVIKPIVGEQYFVWDDASKSLVPLSRKRDAA